ncbi:MAG TPA: biotin--[acetyl-CoA-carboxylase] ligase [Candidatus Dormibacteraeota bacterium]|jgi:BirA family biotin operon repressor/biotin-[acetyl-CoA-carboxylase] ligase|nr:biotin--[acetyl-CoA-carboxylase] ligase [Candidatus Dormibacteraeota bacterium]
MFQAEMSDRLVAEELQADLGRAVIGRKIIVLEQTSSTSDAILQISNADSKEGVVVFAENQTAGRGQRGNRWESAAGKGLWFSVLLRPRIDLPSSPQLTAWAAEAISGAIENEFSLTPTIKLPNDVQIDGRKVAGVLVEMRAQKNAPHLAIAGIGVNVNQSREDFPTELQSRAISLAMALGEQVDRQKFAIALLRKLDRTYRELFGKS